MEASGLEQGDEAEVLEGAEASGRALGELEEAVDKQIPGFHPQASTATGGILSRCSPKRRGVGGNVVPPSNLPAPPAPRFSSPPNYPLDSAKSHIECDDARSQSPHGILTVLSH